MKFDVAVSLVALGLLILACWGVASLYARRQQRIAVEEADLNDTQEWVADLLKEQRLRGELRSPGHFDPTKPLWKTPESTLEDNWVERVLADFRTELAKVRADMSSYHREILAEEMSR